MTSEVGVGQSIETGHGLLERAHDAPDDQSGRHEHTGDRDGAQQDQQRLRLGGRVVCVGAGVVGDGEDLVVQRVEGGPKLLEGALEAATLGQRRRPIPRGDVHERDRTRRIAVDLAQRLAEHRDLGPIELPARVLDGLPQILGVLLRVRGRRLQLAVVGREQRLEHVGTQGVVQHVGLHAVANRTGRDRLTRVRGLQRLDRVLTGRHHEQGREQPGATQRGDLAADRPVDVPTASLLVGVVRLVQVRVVHRFPLFRS